MQVVCLIVLLVHFAVGNAAGQEIDRPSSRDDRVHQQPLVIEIDQPRLLLQAAGGDGRYLSEPFRLHAGSILPRWRVSLLPERITGPTSRARVAPPRVSLIPERALDNPGKSYTAGPITLDGTTVMAVGGPTGGRIHEINSYSVVVECDPLSAPGRYQGSFVIVPEIPGQSTPKQQIQMDYEWEVVELLAVNVIKGRVLDFGTALPGITDSRNHGTIEVFSNHHEAEILIEMQPLTRDGDGHLLPSSATALGWGTDLVGARQDAQSAPFGHNELRIVTGPGHHQFLICGRLQLDPTEPAGSYSGQILVTSRIIRP